MDLPPMTKERGLKEYYCVCTVISSLLCNCLCMVTWLSFCALNTSMSMASWSSSVSMLCPIIVAFTVESTRSWVPRVGIFSHTCTTNQNQHILYAGQSESQAVSLTNRIIIFLTPIREHCSFTEKSESQEVSPTNQKAVQFC